MVRRGLGMLLLAVLAVWARGLAAAMTMEADHAAFWRRRARSPGTVTLVALGDSLAQGLGAIHPERSWAGRLAEAIEERTGSRVRVLVLGVCGAGVADVLRLQLPQVPAAALHGDPGTLIALEVGTNDASGGTDPEEYRRLLTEVCAALPAGSLVGDVPDLQRGRVRVAGARLSPVAREVVAAHPRLRLVRLEAATHRLAPWEFGPDLAHPNGLGYRRFGRAFTAALGS
ncbi:SGNH/GDSL hydrolase family protein [Actinomycetospora sp.]|uniref:SGNH/GDSL hydrolase family protein n=1 Tax=Actinomycetospora sp. TaxID=1872135 RepID=UPI002F421DDF